MNQNGNSNLVKFSVMGVGQIILAGITVVVQRKIANRLTEQDIEKSKSKPIRGFQRTPML